MVQSMRLWSIAWQKSGQVSVRNFETVFYAVPTFVCYWPVVIADIANVEDEYPRAHLLCSTPRDGQKSDGPCARAWEYIMRGAPI